MGEKRRSREWVCRFLCLFIVLDYEGFWLCLGYLVILCLCLFGGFFLYELFCFYLFAVF